MSNQPQPCEATLHLASESTEVFCLPDGDKGRRIQSMCKMIMKRLSVFVAGAQKGRFSCTSHTSQINVYYGQDTEALIKSTHNTNTNAENGHCSRTRKILCEHMHA